MPGRTTSHLGEDALVLSDRRDASVLPLRGEPGVRSARNVAAAEAPPVRVDDSWWTVGAASLAACTLLAACVWVSLHLRADPTLYTVALFGHLACLILGFGAVLVADYFGLLWIVRRCTLGEAIASTTRLHLPIWIGLAGLTISGTMLKPELTSPITQLKLGLVGVLTVNGMQSGLLTRHMKRHSSGPLPPRVIAWGTTTVLTSQVSWWGATAIGFLNHQS